MANVFIMFTLLASFQMYVLNSQFISYGPDCITWMANTEQCQVYYSGHESQPNDSCCSEIEYISTDSYCLCELAAINNSFPFDVTKALTLPSVCGVASPCDGYFLASGSPPPESLKLNDPDNLAPQSRPELSPSYAPNSPLAQPTPSPTAAANTKSSGSINVSPYSISVAVFFISLLFLYFT